MAFNHAPSIMNCKNDSPNQKNIAVDGIDSDEWWECRNPAALGSRHSTRVESKFATCSVRPLMSQLLPCPRPRKAAVDFVETGYSTNSNSIA